RVGGGHAGHAVANEFAGRGGDSVRDYGTGDGRSEPGCRGRTLRQLLGDRAAGARPRGPGAVWAHAARRESPFERSPLGSGQLGGGESSAFSGAARQPTVSAGAIPQRTSQGGRRSGAAPGRSCVSRAEPTAAVSRSGRNSRRSDQGGVSATTS